jgi:hypothetical protein
MPTFRNNANVFARLLAQACTSALQEIPAINAVIDDATQEIVYRNYVDVSVAVASPNGLVVPVLRNTEKMSFSVRFSRALLQYLAFLMWSDALLLRCAVRTGCGEDHRPLRQEGQGGHHGAGGHDRR